MKPRKLKIAFCHFPYGGNGGCSSEAPNVRHWKEATIPKLLSDERIEGWISKDFSDTPITMTRNEAVLWARAQQADIVVMIDSDMWPDPYVGLEPDAKPFWDSSFDFLYENWERGPRGVASPYCGPPPHENVYCFRWAKISNSDANDQFKLDMYGREEASLLTGMIELGAGPTGLIMLDMRLFDLIDPAAVEGLTRESTHAGFFHYEYPDVYHARKASTEDVTCLRELSQAGIVELGYNPIFCNWDAWSIHWKPYPVGKPMLLTTDRVSEKLRAAIRRNTAKGLKQGNIDYTKGLGIDSKIAEAAAEASTVEVEAVGSEKPGTYVVTNAITGQQMVVEEEPAAESVPASLMQEREVAGCKVTSLYFNTSLADLATLTYLVGELAKGYKRPLKIAELGSWVGESAVAMHQGLGPYGGAVYCVDTWLGAPNDATSSFIEKFGNDIVRATFRANTRDLPNIVPVPGRSDAANVLRGIPDGSLDFLFIDAGHSKEEVQLDLCNWLPKMSPTGIICGHDYLSEDEELVEQYNKFPGVREAVHECFDPSLVSHPRGTRLWVVRMKDTKSKPPTPTRPKPAKVARQTLQRERATTMAKKKAAPKKAAKKSAKKKASKK